MDKKILLLYVFANHQHNVERLAAEMRKRGFVLDVFCASNCKGTVECESKSIFRKFVYWGQNSRYSLLQRFTARLTPFLIIKLIRHYDYVDFHSYCPIFYKPIAYCHKHMIKFDITLWGSDLLRSTSKKQSRMAIGFEYAHIIKVMGPGLSKAMHTIYNGKYDIKVICVDFGNMEFEYIERLKIHKCLSDQAFENLENRIVVTCGYNGSEKQNHVAIIDALKRLSKSNKNRILAVFPLTYGCNRAYIDEINARLATIGIPYVALTEYMNQEQIAYLRASTDIMINIQETDAFSGSIQGHLFANNILISGEWLEYQELDEAKVFYIKTTIEKLVKNISDVIENFEVYRERCVFNQVKMQEMKSWNSVASNWVLAYTL